MRVHPPYRIARSPWTLSRNAKTNRESQIYNSGNHIWLNGFSFLTHDILSRKTGSDIYHSANTCQISIYKRRVGRRMLIQRSATKDMAWRRRKTNRMTCERSSSLTLPHMPLGLAIVMARHVIIVVVVAAASTAGRPFADGVRGLRPFRTLLLALAFVFALVLSLRRRRRW